MGGYHCNCLPSIFNLHGSTNNNYYLPVIPLEPLVLLEPVLIAGEGCAVTADWFWMPVVTACAKIVETPAAEVNTQNSAH